MAIRNNQHPFHSKQHCVTVLRCAVFMSEIQALARDFIALPFTRLFGSIFMGFRLSNER